MGRAYYNELDPYAAQWLRDLIAAGLIAPGDVDDRSITEVRSDDLRGYTQCHFFAGIAGWSRALRLAGWSDDRPVWTGSCPCQPFSVAGKRKGFEDDRHLWPIWFDLIKVCRPPVVFGEQVAAASSWLGLVRGDLESVDYAVGCSPIEAASAGADHLRDRYWYVADRDGPTIRDEPRWSGGPDGTGAAIDGDDRQNCHLADDGFGRRPRSREWQGEQPGRAEAERSGNPIEWVIGADGKARRVKSGIRLLAHGVPARVGKLRAFGNAIDPRPAAAFITAALPDLARAA